MVITEYGYGDGDGWRRREKEINYSVVAGWKEKGRGI